MDAQSDEQPVKDERAAAEQPAAGERSAAGEQLAKKEERPLGSRAPAFIKAHRPLHLSWQVGVFLVGLVIVVAGVILLPLPGPGWLIIFGGMAVWATEFVWAQIVMRWTKHKLAQGTAYMRRRRAQRAERKRS